VRGVAARQVDFLEEGVGEVFAAVGFCAATVFEPAEVAFFEGAACVCRGVDVDGLGGGEEEEGEGGEEGFEGDHFWLCCWGLFVGGGLEIVAV